jgi:peptide/nickel transport system ATP-binding protein
MTAAVALDGAPLLSTDGLTIEATMAGQRKLIVSGIDICVAAGETVGIVGESGSGKSMTARAILGLLPPGIRASGQLRFRGDDMGSSSARRRARFRGSEIGMVFQDPFTMLNPLMRAGRHIEETLRDPAGRRLPRDARRAEAIRRLAEVGIADAAVADRYPFELSGGMRQRVGIAAALAADPALLVADEPTTALDVTTQAEILALLRSLQIRRNMGLVLITHDLNVAFTVCDRIYVMYAGRVLEHGTSADLQREPRHPYSLGLLMSDPPLDRRVRTLHSMAGSVPDPGSVAGQCAFADRCEWVQPACRAGAPSLRPAGPQMTACIRAGDIREALQRERELTTEPAAPAEASAQALVAVDSLVKTFRRARHEVWALREATIEIGAGESVGLVGGSGSGKTTLGRCIVGLETASAGTITIAGRDVTDYARLSRQERHDVRSQVQMVFQDPYSSLSPARSIGALLGEALRLDGKRADGRTAADLLELVGLPRTYTNRKPAALSGGERQRVAIARALARQPRLIICDEVVSALDVSVQAQILNLLASLRRELGIAYLFITHDLAVVRQVADRIYVMHQGRIVESGVTAEVLDHPADTYTARLIDSIPSRHSVAGPGQEPASPPAPAEVADSAQESGQSPASRPSVK